MHAQCPECLTYFRVRPEQLKTAHGKVRCSQCRAVFNALEYLCNEPSPADIAAANAERARHVKADAPLLKGDRFAGDLFAQLDYQHNEELPLDEPESSLEAEPLQASDELHLADPDHAFRETARPRSHPALRAANLVLLLLLAVQLVHLNRISLSEHPLAGPYVQRAYAMLGIPLPVEGQLDKISLTRVEVSSHADYPGALHLTAVLENIAARGQPWPVLHIALQDRWGDAVGERFFRPAEYLRRKDATPSLMPSRESFAVELAIQDPGKTAVGFQAEPCLAVNQRIICPTTR